MNWVVLSEDGNLKEINERSFDKALDGVIIFKHSTRCSISTMAKNRLERNWNFNPEKLPVYYLDLLVNRDISNKIAENYNVEHQSPQILLIKDGNCVYTATHSEIDPLTIEEYLNK